jgi:4-carboxymuconolactone decarboxylase
VPAKEDDMAQLLDDFKSQFPDAWSAYEALRDVCDKAGPLDPKAVQLIKIGISAAMEHEGGLVAHIAQARRAGATEPEIYHAILVATGLSGMPATLAAFGTARNALGG